MIYKKLFDAELKLNNINIESNPNIQKAFAFKINDKNYICINGSSSNVESYWMLEHELEHIKNNTLYVSNAPDEEILKNEFLTNDNLIKKLSLDTKVLNLKLQNFSDEQIIEKLKLTKDIYFEIKKKVDVELLKIINIKMKGFLKK